MLQAHDQQHQALGAEITPRALAPTQGQASSGAGSAALSAPEASSGAASSGAASSALPCPESSSGAASSGATSSSAAPPAQKPEASPRPGRRPESVQEAEEVLKELRKRLLAEVERAQGEQEAEEEEQARNEASGAAAATPASTRGDHGDELGSAVKREPSSSSSAARSSSASSSSHGDREHVPPTGVADIHMPGRVETGQWQLSQELTRDPEISPHSYTRSLYRLLTHGTLLLLPLPSYPSSPPPTHPPTRCRVNR